jgi:thioesterase domain-containing protein
VNAPASLAEYYCEKLLTFHEARYGKRPFVLGGWSSGVVIALEMAQQLARVGHAPALLVAIDKAPRNTKAEIDPLRNSFFLTYISGFGLHGEKTPLYMN